MPPTIQPEEPTGSRPAAIRGRSAVVAVALVVVVMLLIAAPLVGTLIGAGGGAIRMSARPDASSHPTSDSRTRDSDDSSASDDPSLIDPDDESVVGNEVLDETGEFPSDDALASDEGYGADDVYHDGGSGVTYDDGGYSGGDDGFDDPGEGGVDDPDESGEDPVPADDDDGDDGGDGGDTPGPDTGPVAPLRVTSMVGFAGDRALTESVGPLVIWVDWAPAAPAEWYVVSCSDPTGAAASTLVEGDRTTAAVAGAPVGTPVGCSVEAIAEGRRSTAVEAAPVMLVAPPTLDASHLTCTATTVQMAGRILRLGFPDAPALPDGVSRATHLVEILDGDGAVTSSLRSSRASALIVVPETGPISVRVRVEYQLESGGRRVMLQSAAVALDAC